VLSALTHMSSRKSIKDEVLLDMNMHNRLMITVDNNRWATLHGIEGVYQTNYDSSHYILVKKVSKMYWEKK